MLAVYSASLMRAGLTMANTFAKNTVTSFELSDQSETISLLLRDFSESASDWLWEMNATGNLTRGQDEFQNSLGVGFTSIAPGDYKGNLVSENNQILNMRSIDGLRSNFKEQKNFRDLVISSSGSEGSKWISLSGKPLYNQKKEFIGFRGVASDITEKKHTEERIAYLAHNDALTGLVNRANFAKALDEMVSDSAKNKQWSIFYLDLDGFKIVMTPTATSMGDRLLGEVAKSLKKVVPDRDIVARFGCRDGSDAHTLMNNADLALYRAKAEGRGVFRLYEHHMDEIVKERRSLEIDLKSAVEQWRVVISVPAINISKRYQNKSLGIIAEIGDWVLHRACIEAVKWPEHLSVAVNLSPQQFKSNHITNIVIDALSKSGLAPSRLELEITEGLFMENTEEVLYSLRELKGMGVSISLDDFGTGYSSLSYLLKFPFDKLKIDRSLIRSLDTDPNAKNVLEAITKLASVMNLTVTAEELKRSTKLKCCSICIVRIFRASCLDSR
ncbi:hypothetical protein GQR58_005178 [Nymphon striatum]|nr:hypothetical protein GQR58_005178 [Nymphon striatum]